MPNMCIKSQTQFKKIGAKLYSWDKKDSLQKAPDFMSHALTFTEI
jgi:hypothetical protein